MIFNREFFYYSEKMINDFYLLLICLAIFFHWSGFVGKQIVLNTFNWIVSFLIVNFKKYLSPVEINTIFYYKLFNFLLIFRLFCIKLGCYINFILHKTILNLYKNLIFQDFIVFSAIFSHFIKIFSRNIYFYEKQIYRNIF